jgi:hypothetical protein
MPAPFVSGLRVQFTGAIAAWLRTRFGQRLLL